MTARPAIDDRRHAQGNGRTALARALLCASIAGVLSYPVLGTDRGHADPANPTDTAEGAYSGANDDASFDRQLLSGAGRNTSDLSRFERGNFVFPGSYRTDIFLNGIWVGRGDIRFASPTPDASAQPCLTRAIYLQLGLPLSKLDADKQARLAETGRCVAIGDLIPDAQAVFDQPNLRLDVSVPQAWLGQRARGYVDPANWDRGVTAGLLNYNFNSYRSRSHGISQTSSFLGLGAGLNVGAWQFRHDSTLVTQSGVAGSRSHTHWQSLDTYLRRDLVGMRAQLTLGDSYTSGDLFDSVSIRGVQLATDDRMLPDSLRGYAPTVRGVAQSNAKVTIRQNGIVLYQTTVAPGPFSISDLYATGYGGDLVVTVTEANGRVRSFTVPYASVPQLLRPGISRFSLAAGQLHDASIHAHPGLAEATLQRGFTNLLSGYAGVVASTGYGAAQIGTALNTRIGALALDLTEAHTALPGQPSRNGQSLRLSYSKILPTTDTSLSVATYRYSTRGYLGLRDAMTLRDIALGYRYVDPTTLTTIDGVATGNLLTPDQLAALQGRNPDNFATYTSQLDRQRSRFDVNLNQRLGTRGGTLYLTGSAIDYWNRNGTDVQFQAGYNNTVGRLSYNLSATRTRAAFSRTSNEFFASFTLPLGDATHAPTFGMNLSHDDTGHSLSQATLNGTLGVDNQFSYGATASHDNGGDGSAAGNAGTVFAGYRSPFVQLNGSAGGGHGYSQSSLGISGAIVAHPGGVTFGLPMGDTIAVVKAKDATGARVINAAGVRIDRFGYALVPYMTPFALNNVQIDPKGLPLNVQLDATSAQVAPHAGAVVMVDFKTEYGRTVVFRIRRTDGLPVPFGAEILDAHGDPVGVVGQGGQALVRGVKDEGELQIRWQLDGGIAGRCSMPYHLPPASRQRHSQGLQMIPIRCTPIGAAGSST